VARHDIQMKLEHIKVVVFFTVSLEASGRMSRYATAEIRLPFDWAHLGPLRGSIMATLPVPRCQLPFAITASMCASQSRPLMKIHPAIAGVIPTTSSWSWSLWKAIWNCSEDLQAAAKMTPVKSVAQSASLRPFLLYLPFSSIAPTA
jgi:hypothetical protein